MTAVKDYQEVYLSNFAEREKEFAAGPAWLNQVRKEAIERFADLGFPTTRLEAWKFTSVAPIAGMAFQPAPRAADASTAEGLKTLCHFDLDCSRLVFVNGHFSAEFSSLAGLPKGIHVGSLAGALSNGAPQLEQHLARHADFQDHAFVALNTAFMEDGAFIEIANGLVFERPIYLLYVSTAAEGSEPAVSFPRTLILAGRESQATFIEGHIGLDDAPSFRALGRARVPQISRGGVYFTNAVTEIVAGENAVVEYAKFQQEGHESFHIATVQVRQERASSVSTRNFTFGGALVREDLNIVLAGEGANAHLDGLYITLGRQHVDHHTTIDHAQPHCDSRELYKGVLEDRSSAVFNGRIIVRKDAQKTDSKQSNKNLLLSEEAVINTKPQLEIFADDVKCTHGATIGQVDQEAIFYLRSRGIGRDEARNLLTYAFANEVIDRVKHGPMRDRLREALFMRMGRGLGRKET
ncbi:MAG: Fe-S cluster assembly protein SufD [Terriglobia bacterium]